MLSDSEIANIVGAEEEQAIGYLGEGSEIQSNRATLLDYYNQRPYGDEIEGQSQVVTSDVSDVVEGMLPQLLRMFTQGRNVATFTSTRPEYDDEAKAKTEYTNWVFNNLHDPVLILHNMFKDALLQYTGVVKVSWDDSEETKEESYKGLSESELQLLKLDENYNIKDVEQDEYGLNVTGERVNKTGKPCIENIPPDELLIARRSRDFDNPPFIGQYTPKTRSDLIEMGFDRKVVMELGKDEEVDTEVKLARDRDLENGWDSNPTGDKSKDIIYLGEYYIYMDADEDGISELWQVFYAEGKVLEKTRVDDHPFCVCVPVPMPHRAIGSCPADQVADLQFLKSTLVRQMLNNIYSTNYNRMIVNERVDLDDLLTPRAGGVIRVDGQGPVGDSVTPLVTQPQVQGILQAIEYTDTMREIRTGITRYNQGLDTESLNKTATGFQGIRDMSQMRIELIARVFADTGVKKIFEKLVELASKYQNEQIQLRVHGQPLEIDPSSWKYDTDCIIDIGLGSGDRQEKVANLNFFYQQQKELMQLGSPLVDAKKLYNTLDKVATEVGLKGAETYFNDPEVPTELLMAEIEKLTRENQQLMAMTQNPLAEAEQVKAQAQIQLKQLDAQVKMLQEQLKAAGKTAELEQKERFHDDNMAMQLVKEQSDILQKEAETGSNINEREIVYLYDELTGSINLAI
jgi:ElaB/YqjD/DUF883 family membrane-anchored ribosome-binding protein